MKFILRHFFKQIVILLSVGLLFACSDTNQNNSSSSPDLEAKNLPSTLKGYLSSSNTLSVGDLPTAQQISMASQINTAELKTALEAQQTKISADSVAMQLLANATSASATFSVFRFWNTVTGAHFYTISPVERDSIKANLPVFKYEGIVFGAANSAAIGTSPVYRFYNNNTSTHFFTISETEKNYVLANFPQFTLEGVSYYASQTPLTGWQPLYRFYHWQKGFHFYTASVVGRDYVIANFPTIYNYENIAYYVKSKEAAVGPFNVGGNLAGLLSGHTITLNYSYYNATDVHSVTLATNGAFAGLKTIEGGGGYNVSIASVTGPQNCSLTNGVDIAYENVNSIQINCAIKTYTVGGNISGLGTGKSIQLLNNGSNALTTGSNGAFGFSTQLTHGTIYTVTIATQPTNQTCTFANASGTALNTVTNIQINCVNNVTIGGTLVGLLNSRPCKIHITHKPLQSSQLRG